DVGDTPDLSARKSARADAYDRDGNSFHQDGTSDRTRITAELVFPVFIRDDGNGWRPGMVIIGNQQPACDRNKAERFKIGSAHPRGKRGLDGIARPNVDHQAAE